MKYLLILLIVNLQSCSSAKSSDSGQKIKIVWWEYLDGLSIRRLENDEVICYTSGTSGISCKWK